MCISLTVEFNYEIILNDCVYHTSKVCGCTCFISVSLVNIVIISTLVLHNILF